MQLNLRAKEKKRKENKLIKKEISCKGGGWGKLNLGGVLSFDGWVLCRVRGEPYRSGPAMEMRDRQGTDGRVKPHKLFLALSSLCMYVCGRSRSTQKYPHSAWPTTLTSPTSTVFGWISWFGSGSISLKLSPISQTRSSRFVKDACAFGPSEWHIAVVPAVAVYAMFQIHNAADDDHTRCKADAGLYDAKKPRGDQCGGDQHGPFQAKETEEC